MLNQLDLNILKHLACLLNELSVSSAAKKMNLTQSAMSKSLKKLREVFKDELITKTPQGYVLTEFAIHLKPQITKFLSEAENLLTPCTEFNPLTEKTTIKIIGSDYANLIFLPEVLQLLKPFPNVSLEVFSPQEEDLSKLQIEDLDFYMGIGNMELLPETLIAKKIFSETLLSATAPEHPLNKKVTVEEFCSFPHLLISNTNLNSGKVNLTYRVGVIDLALKKMGLSRDVQVVVPHFSVAPLLLPNSQYILTAPARLIKYFEKLIPLKTFTPPISEKLNSEFYVAWHPVSLNKRSNQWFKKEILDKIKF